MGAISSEDARWRLTCPYLLEILGSGLEASDASEANDVKSGERKRTKNDKQDYSLLVARRNGPLPVGLGQVRLFLLERQVRGRSATLVLVEQAQLYLVHVVWCTPTVTVGPTGSRGGPRSAWHDFDAFERGGESASGHLVSVDGSRGVVFGLAASRFALRGRRRRRHAIARICGGRD